MSQWAYGPEDFPPEWCCDKFRMSLEEDTDTEGYRLITWWNGRFNIGSAVTPLADFDFCPWCGKKVDHSRAAFMPK